MRQGRQEDDMKLTYWVAKCLNDSDAYSIRTRTKKECEAQKALAWRDDYGPVTKVTVDYSDGFDLMYMCSEESGRWWESDAWPTPTPRETITSTVEV
jgi:hypothetical protein